MGSLTPTLKGVVAFTGRLATMRRAQAFATVRQQGGKPRRGVTKDTNVLVVGQLGWPLIDDGRPSNSLQRARSLGVPIISEPRFLELAGLGSSQVETRAYAQEQIASLSGLPGEVVEKLAVFGLLDPRDGQYGFRDLASARQLAGLLSRGVRLSTITRSLNEIRRWLPDAGLPNVRLIPTGTDELILPHREGHTDTKGQYVLPLERPEDNVEAVFERAQSAEENEDWELAERLYRRAMSLRPKDPAAPFNLGNMLRDLGRPVEAEYLFRTATKVDWTFAEAWFNLADVLDEGGQPADAVRCLERAVSIKPNYADAFFNLGLLQQKLCHFEEATACWRKYLTLDRESPGSARARRALKYCQLKATQFESK